MQETKKKEVFLQIQKCEHRHCIHICHGCDFLLDAVLATNAAV